MLLVRHIFVRVFISLFESCGQVVRTSTYIYFNGCLLHTVQFVYNKRKKQIQSVYLVNYYLDCVTSNKSNMCVTALAWGHGIHGNMNIKYRILKMCVQTVALLLFIFFSSAWVEMFGLVRAVCCAWQLVCRSFSNQWKHFFFEWKWEIG